VSSQLGDITVPGRPEVHEVSAGIYAYMQPDGTWWINNTGGHGPAFGDQEPIDDTLDCLRFVLDVAAGCRDAGVAPLQAARDTDLGRFAAWPDAERVVGNRHRVCAELDGTPRGGSIDIAAALADMVAHNGGAPLTCLA
jgi:cyclase